MSTFDKYCQNPLTWVPDREISIKNDGGDVIARLTRPLSSASLESSVSLDGKTWRFYKAESDSGGIVDRLYLAEKGDTKAIFEGSIANAVGRLKFKTGTFFDWDNFAGKKYSFKMNRKKVVSLSKYERTIYLESPWGPLPELSILTLFAVYLVTLSSETSTSRR